MEIPTLDERRNLRAEDPSFLIGIKKKKKKGSTALEQREGGDGSGKQCQLNCLKPKVSAQNPAHTAKRS